MKKRVLLLVLAAVLLLSSTAFAQSEAADTRVFDYAGLFGAEDADTLSAAIIDFQENTGYDFAILVTDVDHGYDDYQQLADDFYLSKSLGLGMNHTAILCYLDLHGDGFYYISVFGDLKNLMVAEDIQYLAETAMDYFTAGNFSDGFIWTMSILTEALTNLGSADQATRVFDYAKVLTEENKAALETAIADFRTKSGMDFLYLSTYEDMEGNADGAYMIDFYEKHGFGEGDNHSGAMIYLDMYTGSYFVQNFGAMDAVVTQEDLHAMVSGSDALISEGKIFDAVEYIVQAYAAYFQ